jgi:hypothetical protein
MSIRFQEIVGIRQNEVDVTEQRAEGRGTIKLADDS